MKKFFIILAFLLSFIFYHLSSTPINAATLNVCPSGCPYAGGDGIQQAIDAAKDGDTISIDSGEYNRRPPAKETKCFIDTKGKSLTIKGSGGPPLLNSQNDQYHYTDIPGLSRVGVCINGGRVTLDSVIIQQTTSPAIDARGAQLIVKNTQFLDIDHATIVLHQTQAMILNSLFTGSAGPGIIVGDISYTRVENNTFFGNGGAGVVFDLCRNNEPSGDVKNNLIVNPGDLFGSPLSGSGVGAECRDQQTKAAKIKTSNNFVWKGRGTDGCLDPPEKGTSYPDCVAGEICTGSTVGLPGFIGADEKGTVCVYGEGFTAGDFHTRPESPATQAGAGYGFGPCADGTSASCTNYIKNNPFPAPSPTPTESPQPTFIPQGPGSVGQRSFGKSEVSNITNLQSSLEYILKNLPLPGAKKIPEKIGFDLFLYLIFSAVYIMFIHFAVGIKDFNIFLMLGYFILGGLVGYWFHSYEAGLVLSIILSLIFI